MMNNKSFRKLRPTTQKILILLLGGVTLALSSSPRKHFQIIKSIQKNWEWIDRHNLYRNIKTLYRSRLIDKKDNPDGTTRLILNDLGRAHAIRYKIGEMKIRPMKKWDLKWRIVMFDIPEKQKKARDALAHSLKNIGFHQFQKSVFINPFECRDELDFVIEFFNVRPYVRFLLTEKIDDDLVWKKKFALL